MARVISFVTKRYIWVGVVKKHDSLPYVIIE